MPKQIRISDEALEREKRIRTLDRSLAANRRAAKEARRAQAREARAEARAAREASELPDLDYPARLRQTLVWEHLAAFAERAELAGSLVVSLAPHTFRIGEGGAILHTTIVRAVQSTRRRAIVSTYDHLARWARQVDPEKREQLAREHAWTLRRIGQAADLLREAEYQVTSRDARGRTRVARAHKKLTEALDLLE